MNNLSAAKQEVPLLQKNLLNDKNLHRFSHFAMATVFEVFIYHNDALYAKRAATEIFIEIDRLETLLSKFIENSEISKINSLRAFESTVVDPDTYICLQECASLYQESKGLFDVSAGALINLWKDNKKKDRREIEFLMENSGMPWLQFNDESFEITVLNDNIELDLGGYGKGYALDKAVEILNEWEIERYLLHGGTSSVRVAAAPHNLPGWPLNILHKDKIVPVKNISIGASGLEKGRHIINPYSGRPVTKRMASWVFAPSAALADALSTAFMLMPKKEIEQYCRKNSSVLAVIYLNNGTEWRFNKFNN